MTVRWINGLAAGRARPVYHDASFRPPKQQPIRTAGYYLTYAGQITVDIRSDGQKLPDRENGRPKMQIVVMAGIRYGYTVLN